ncbi:hypothetical protein GGI35DRAFT_433728 [Trichoderma velutinum]
MLLSIYSGNSCQIHPFLLLPLPVFFFFNHARSYCLKTHSAYFLIYRFIHVLMTSQCPKAPAAEMGSCEAGV